MRFLLILIVLLTSAPALAQESLFVVTRVPVGDALNVRTTPSANGEVKEQLTNGDIVTSFGKQDGPWMPICVDPECLEMHSWVSARYIQRIAPLYRAGTGFPVAAKCAVQSGTALSDYQIDWTIQDTLAIRGKTTGILRLLPLTRIGGRTAVFQSVTVTFTSEIDAKIEIADMEALGLDPSGYASGFLKCKPAHGAFQVR